ncbi:MAG: DegT/DnrJ/EryC1/StrS family aminotransferase [Planctomycetota bacterium]|jgi:dTDP-4-amino-4,6-dideoxygalactose transaminase|nr:erythromycin biosynthesis sensory transduction protein eryC1 [Planctomycetota bacterium]MDP6520994.1 DegT/DnrJ/EryC1/StrS family aminotransferase [Planctomycetota bacterium]MDP6955184.1 DegT/DnrJ/EryC1/StrS family aminotransferase [Planctomycetota bacterium]
MDHIPILNLKPQLAALRGEIQSAMDEVLDATAFINGPAVRAFESAAAEYLGVRHAVGLNSGTDALVIGLRALGIGPGDEVITSPFSFFATAESISAVGATPVFVDIDEESFNIDVSLIEAAITERTKAILPVHLFGRPAQMDALLALARTNGLTVLEDCAQSIGARYGSGADDAPRQTGSLGDAGAFSFFPTKNLGAYGDGGLFVTDSDELAQTARKLSNHGSIERYRNEILGYNSRLDSLQAAVLNVKLPHLDTWNNARRAVAGRYGELLGDIPGVLTPEITPGHVFHQYTVRLTEVDPDGGRDRVVERMSAAGVSAMVYYPLPQDELPVYAGRFPACPVSHRLGSQVISLPIWPELEGETQARVAQALAQAL